MLLRNLTNMVIIVKQIEMNRPHYIKHVNLLCQQQILKEIERVTIYLAIVYNAIKFK